MNDRLKSLYKSQILTNSRDESNFRELDSATHILEAYNPMCGDQYKLYLRIENEVIEEASFHGYGCAISKASTAVLVKRIKGKDVKELGPLTTLFMRLIDPESEEEIERITSDEELLAFAGTRQYPERQKCASLSWDEFIAFLDLGENL